MGYAKSGTRKFENHLCHTSDFERVWKILKFTPMRTVPLARFKQKLCSRALVVDF